MSKGYKSSAYSQSFILLTIISIISVGGCFLINIGMGAGIRLNSEQTKHPYHYFTAWRYGLCASMPILALVLTWIYHSRPKFSMMSEIHRVVSFANLAWMAVVLACEAVVLTQCNDPSGVYIYDHPQCINRNTPIDTTPDVSWQLIFAGIIVNVACGVWWVICSFTIESASKMYMVVETMREPEKQYLKDADDVATKISKLGDFAKFL